MAMNYTPPPPPPPPPTHTHTPNPVDTSSNIYDFIPCVIIFIIITLKVKRVTNVTGLASNHRLPPLCGFDSHK